MLHYPHRKEEKLIIPYSSCFESFSAKTDILPNSTQNQYRELVNIIQMSDSASDDLRQDVAFVLAPASHELLQESSEMPHHDQSSVPSHISDDTPTDIDLSPSQTINSTTVSSVP